MKKKLSHYESLNVTRDAPAEVIRAAYRSLSQRHHPDKNSGNPEAAEMMMRLNTAYDVLSDPEQRLLYDRQMLEEQMAGNSDVAIGSKVLKHLNSRQGRVALAFLTTLSAAIVYVSWNSRKDDNMSTVLAQSAVYSTAVKEAGNGDWPAPYYVRGSAQNDDKGAKAKKSVTVIDVSDASGLVSNTQEQPGNAPPSKAPAAAAAPASAPVKQSEFERLTSMLKSMGLGLHKLDAEPAKPAPTTAPAVAPATPAAPLQASRAATVQEPARAREEVERAAAPEPARSEARALAEASRPAQQAPAVATSSASQRGTVVADARRLPYPHLP